MDKNLIVPVVFIRILAIACIIAGIFAFVNPYLGFMCPPLSESNVCAVKSKLYLGELSSVLTLLGLIGLYVTRAKNVGVLGFIGFLIAFIGGVMEAGSAWMREFLYPILKDLSPDLLADGYPPALSTVIQIGFDMMILGWFLFGIASIRGKAFSTKAPIFLLIGIVLGRFVPLGFLLGEPLFGVALIIMGRSVWLSHTRNDDQSSASRDIAISSSQTTIS